MNMPIGVKRVVNTAEDIRRSMNMAADINKVIYEVRRCMNTAADIRICVHMEGLSSYLSENGKPTTVTIFLKTNVLLSL